MSPPLVKVCVLGSSAVGKSTLIQQFVHNQFDEHYAPTAPRGTTLYCSSSLNGHIYHFKLIDMPAIKEFPSSSLAEWTEFQNSEMRTAHAYLFVFDLSTPASFHYVKTLRDQLFDSRNMTNVPVWVVGNKADLCMNVLATMRSHKHDHHHQRQLLHPSQHQGASPYEDIMPAFKDLANLVRKQWKCSYLECSAKFNWRVMPIFREIVKSLESSLLTSDSGLQPQLHLMSSGRDSQSKTRRGSSLRPSHPTPDAALTNRCPLPDDNQAPGSHSNSICAIV